MKCEARQYSDQMRCDRCQAVWDINDPYPPCLRRDPLLNSGWPFLVVAALMLWALTAVMVRLI